MANTTSKAYTFEKDFTIADIVEEAFERVGFPNVSGYELRAARRSLNILFQEWGNRGIHYWQVGSTNIRLVQGQTLYSFYRSPQDGSSNGVTTTLDGAIASTSATTGITLASSAGMPEAGTLQIGSENITYTSISGSEVLGGVVRGANNTTAATHSDGDAVTQIELGLADILEAYLRNNMDGTSQSDTPLGKVDRSTYGGYANKLSQGTPSNVWVQRFIDRITLNVYPTSDSSNSSKYIQIFFVKRVQDAGTYSNATDVPYRFVPALCAGLAYYLSQKYRMEKTQSFKLLYEDELARALQEDGSATSTFVTPKAYYPSVS